MIKLTWASTAQSDLAQIRRYISRHNPAASRAVARKIIATTDLLIDYPELGVRTRLESVHRLVVRDSPYIIYYKLDETGIEILEIFDGRQGAPRSLKDDV